MHAKRGQALVPVGADVGHPGHRLRERLRPQRVAGLAPTPLAHDEPRVGEPRELLRHRLPRHREAGGQLGRGCAPALRDGADEVPPAGISERGEDAVYAAVHASADAWSSSAVDHSGERSRTRSRVPSGTSSSVNATSPWSSQSSTSRLPGSTSRTIARRSSPSPQRKTPMPPGLGSSSTSLANHSSRRSASVSACQTSSGGVGKTTSRVTSTAPPIRNSRVAYYSRN